MKNFILGIIVALVVALFFGSVTQASNHRKLCADKNGIYIETESSWICIKKDSQIRLEE